MKISQPQTGGPKVMRISPYSSNYSYNGTFCRLLLALILLLPITLGAQSPAEPVANGGTAEQRTARALESARGNPLDLRAFLVRMPKGADLHNHLSGAVYAESFIRDAAEDGLCVDLSTHSFVRAPVTGRENQPACGGDRVAAAAAFADQHLYDTLIDAFSMRGFVPSAGVTGHDHFFDTFGKFGGTDPRHFGEWLDEVATRAAAQNEQYLELMDTPDFSHAMARAQQVGWKDDLAQLRSELLARGLRDEVTVARAHLDAGLALRNQREHCGRSDATPACKVEIRFLYQVLRANPKEVVFAQTLLGFETAAADSREVGINYVQPEDGTTSMADYALQMRMVGFLHAIYPKVHISLHAGELAPGMVPPEGLCCHIRLAVEEAHAERIGHGVDVLYEDRPYDLLKEMASKHVMVEINLTSNDVILGIRGKEHPLTIYRRYNVPVALSTDDEGVSRIDLTHEYVRAVETYGLRYGDLKKMVRTGVEHEFVPGVSLWSDPDVFARPAAACSHDTLGGQKPSAACVAFLRESEKAQQQWELESRFRGFEAAF
jgi:adenosine deaminase